MGTSAIHRRLRYAMQSITRNYASVVLLAALFALSPYAHSEQPAKQPNQTPTQLTAEPQAFYDFEASRQPVIQLDGRWRFHLGDDPDGSKQWASPSFDDSSWPLVAADDPWGPPGHRNPDSIAWYRARIRIPAGAPPLSLNITWMIDCYQVFADGRHIGSFGAMPPHAQAQFFQLRQLYPVTLSPSPQARTITLAIRLWRWPRWAGLNADGIGGPLALGESQLLESRLAVANHADAWDVADILLLIAIEGLAALASLAFFALRRQEREYLWFGLAFLFSVISRCLDIYTQFHAVSIRTASIADNLLSLAGTLAELAFYYTLLRGRRDWLLRFVLITLVLQQIADTILTFELGSFTTWLQIAFVLGLPQSAWVLALLFRRTRQGLPDARLLFFPVLLQVVVGTLSRCFDLANLLNVPGMPPAWFAAPSRWPFKFSIPDVADALFLMAMLAIFIYRFTRTSRRQDESQREREAARTIQQVLVPEELPEIPGFSIQSIYRPFGEVGGDFFQILPLHARPGSGRNPGLAPAPASAQSSVLIAIGDVSGKGLPAAMLVSLLVGTLRALVETTTSPAALLTSLNRLVLGRSNGGFTTCLILLARADGTLTMANAGHLPPYIDGRDKHSEGSLPLGLSPGIVYAETTLHLEAGQTLTLLTDGVLEAQNPAREIFGFERLNQLLSKCPSAEQIADSAIHFGQEDDITVLTITRLAESSPDRGDHAHMALSSSNRVTGRN